MLFETKCTKLASKDLPLGGILDNVFPKAIIHSVLRFRKETEVPIGAGRLVEKVANKYFKFNLHIYVGRYAQTEVNVVCKIFKMTMKGSRTI